MTSRPFNSRCLPKVAFLVACLAPGVSPGQSISSGAGAHPVRQFSPPIRTASAQTQRARPNQRSHVRTVEYLAETDQVRPIAEAAHPMPGLPWGGNASAHSHQVIQSPDRRPAHKTDLAKQRHAKTHPPLLSKHHPIQPAPALIPQAKQREIWKTPYSYGYFGASSSRHWSLHHGYRDRHTEWRRR